MTASRLAQLLPRGAAAGHVVCFGRDGKERRAGELVSAAVAVETRLDALEGERWAIDLSDAFDFTAALLGCWAAGRTPVLAPPTLLATLGAAAYDGVIESESDADELPMRIAFQSLEPSARRPLGKIGPDAALVLYTSGSTGAPKQAGRRLENIESELAALEAVFGASLGAGRVFSTVSHRHVYGLLFRILWPLLERRPFATFDCEYPEQLEGDIGRGNVLISSPAMLKRIGHLPAGAGEWAAVFSSGGVLPADGAADVRRVLGAEAMEVLGSTETSGVAWRKAGGESFTLLPSVEVRVSSDDLLEVRSPFAGVDGWQSTGDRVLFRNDGTFELLGRADRVAKIEDKRVSLSEIERRLLEHRYVEDVAAVALEGGGRQYVGAVVELSQAGREALKTRGRAAVSSDLRYSLRGRIDAVALPRAFRFPETIPVDAQGKRRVGTLVALFGKKAMTTEPTVLELRVTPPKAELRIEVPADLQYFAGHFPGAPIVAGVVQLKWAVDAARRHLGIRGDVVRMENLKFQRVLVPKSQATLTLEWKAASRKLHFSYTHEGERFSSGRLELKFDT